MSDKPILTADDLDESRARAAEPTMNDGSYSGAIRAQYAFRSAKDIRAHDESHGVSTEALLAVMRGDAVIVPREETEEMLAAAISAENDPDDGDTWAAKLAASPWAPKKETE